MLNGNVKHIIWDWNGTLFNDVVLCKDIMNNILTRFNLPLLSLEKYRDVFTFPVQDYYRNTGLDFNKTSFEILGKDFMDEYEQRKYECALYPGVVDGLFSFKSKGITQSILSAYHNKTLEQIVEYFEIRHFFEKLHGLDNIYAGGKIEIGKELVNSLPYGRDEIVLIGDTIHDKDVAEELGVDVIIISNGHQDHEKLTRLNVPVYMNFESFIQSGLSNLSD